MHHYRYQLGRIDDDTDKFHIELSNEVSQGVVIVTGNVGDLIASPGFEFVHDRSARVDLLGEAIASALNEATRGPEEGEVVVEVES